MPYVGGSTSGHRLSGHYSPPIEAREDRVLLGFHTNDLEMWDDEQEYKDNALRHCPAEFMFLVEVNVP